MVKKTLCPFCSFGCELGIVFDDFGIKGVEYLKDTPNGGRLCPRGSASVLYLNHPKRLSVPVYKDRYIGWENIKKELKTVLENPEKVAVAMDRNLTIEEENLVFNFCHRYKIKNLVSTYLEPESFLDFFIIDEREPVGLEDIEKSQILIVIGDVFNYAPMISKNIISWKFADRNNRLVVIDSLRTHTSYFASDFLMTKPGTEAIVLFTLMGEKFADGEPGELTGIPEKAIQNIGKDFKSAKNGLIIVSMPFAHSYEPRLLAEGTKRLSEYSGKKVMPVFEFIHHKRLNPFGRILNLIKEEEIRYIINFGELFPFYYPQLDKDISGIKIYSTSTLRFNDFVQLPSALNMEKSGTILTTFGKRSFEGRIMPASGAKSISQIFEVFGLETDGSATENNVEDRRVDIKDGMKRIGEKIRQNRDGVFVLFGEKVSYYYMGLLDKPILKINPHDAQKIGLKQKDHVFVESPKNRVSMQIKITSDVPQGVLFTQPETPEVRGLFDYELFNDYLYFVPTGVRIWQEG
ncbi:MAG: molybdopterin dinucleotide binding domain-containing protein [bacterium]